ncbi:hypothetical protein SKAU_G00413240 [Synaphobranchus kaupii]|uniref:Uncharacterized protein n=1 Tax=Synaphobranchus kaupii TaxID=118154 RepID=A0A9Q1IB55_SYNKA|nr:hypothetical protein SKAU_G00413240 [Synaphobranchus kaupii]
MRAKAEQERAKLPKITSLFQQAAKVDSNVTADASAVSSPPDPATASNPPVSSESRQTDSPAAPLQLSELAVPHASRQEVTGESSRSPPAPDKASDPPREKRMRGQRVIASCTNWLDSLPPFERAQARVRIEQVLLEAEFPGGRSQEIEESGGRMFLNL